MADKLRRSGDWPKVHAPTADGCATCGVPLGTMHTDECRAAHGFPHPDRWAVPGYEALRDVLGRAFDQAAAGKGAERHAQGQPFDQQPMQDLIRLYGPGFALGQAAKKAQESQRLPRDRAVAELLGAINYLAGAVIAIEAGHTDHQP